MQADPEIPQLSRGDTKFIIQFEPSVKVQPKSCLCFGKVFGKPKEFSALMEHDELNEIHLNKALESKTDVIPTPDVIQIDEEIYDKLYPPVPLPKRRIFQPLHNDDLVEYDMDSSDQAWLDQQEWDLDQEDFEMCMEWLENESERQVPTFDSLLMQSFVKYLDFEAIQGIYDYWLDKRLNGKQKLLYRVKRASKRKRTKYQKTEDPYVAFRQCHEKMYTRKNRSLEQETYTKALCGRRKLYQWFRLVFDLKKAQKKKLETVKMKISMFEEQYKSGQYVEPHMTCPMRFLDSKIHDDSSEFEDSNESDEDSSSYSSDDSDDSESFEFVPTEGCKYYAPVKDDSGLGWSDSPEEPPTKFFKTSDGALRKRLGRGGRILYDRGSSSDCSSHQETFEKYLCPAIPIKKLKTNQDQNQILLTEVHKDHLHLEIIAEPTEINLKPNHLKS